MQTLKSQIAEQQAKLATYERALKNGNQDRHAQAAKQRMIDRTKAEIARLEERAQMVVDFGLEEV